MQTTGSEPRQAPAAHSSCRVQASPSSQEAELSTWTQVAPRTQASLVQGLPSSQGAPSPARQKPATHVSPALQGLPSSQAAVAGTCTQPTNGWQVSAVQTLPSSHGGALPAM